MNTLDVKKKIYETETRIKKILEKRHIKKAK